MSWPLPPGSQQKNLTSKKYLSLEILRTYFWLKITHMFNPGAVQCIISGIQNTRPQEDEK